MAKLWLFFPAAVLPWHRSARTPPALAAARRRPPAPPQCSASHPLLGSGAAAPWRWPNRHAARWAPQRAWSSSRRPPPPTLLPPPPPQGTPPFALLLPSDLSACSTRPLSHCRQCCSAAQPGIQGPPPTMHSKLAVALALLLLAAAAGCSAAAVPSPALKRYQSREQALAAMAPLFKPHPPSGGVSAAASLPPKPTNVSSGGGRRLGGGRLEGAGGCWLSGGRRGWVATQPCLLQCSTLAHTRPPHVASAHPTAGQAVAEAVG